MNTRFTTITSIVCFLSIATIVQAGHPVSDFFEKQVRVGQLKPDDWSKLRELISKSTQTGEKITPEIQTALYEIEEKHFSHFTPESQRAYRALLAQVGGRFKNLAAATQLPSHRPPFWIESEDPIKNYRSSPTLPHQADIVIIGAGLTGTSAAYHLMNAARSGKTVLVLEASHPAAGASGRNGGNFQLLPENYLGKSYDGLVNERLKWLQIRYPEKDPVTLKSEAESQAKTLVRFSFLNMDRLRKIVRDERIECDLSDSGWLKIASTPDEEKALLGELAWLQSLGAKGVEVLSPQQIQDQIHIPAHFSGRLIRGSGNYHPFKFVREVLKKTLAGGIKVYTGVEVKQVSPMRPGEVIVKTNEGEIKAGRVIVATNAYTPLIFPELKGIQCVPSQVVTLDHMPNSLQGYTVTERYGDIYYNFPRSTQRTDQNGKATGTLLYGLDFSEAATDPHHISPSQGLLQEQMTQIYERYPDSAGQPPSRCWVGPMGFSDDRVPSIGFLSKDVIVAAGFQGYGGSFCIEAGYVAAEMAMTGETPSEVPAEIFSPKRLLKK